MVTRSGKTLGTASTTKQPRKGKEHVQHQDNTHSSENVNTKNNNAQMHQIAPPLTSLPVPTPAPVPAQAPTPAPVQGSESQLPPGKLVTPIVTKSQDLPSSASIRPWRTPRTQKTSLQVQSRVKKSFEKRMEEKEKKVALLARIRDMQELQVREKREERERLKAKRERREANVAKANMGKVQVVKNVSKIKKMNRKQRASLGTADVT